MEGVHPSDVLPSHFSLAYAKAGNETSPADVRVVTSAGLAIPAHSIILGSASPVLERMLDRPRKKGRWEKKVPILGVPGEAAIAFIRFLYSSKCSEEEMGKYGMHLLVLSHVFRVPSMKRACERGLVGSLTAENVVDVLQLAGQCDAAWLAVRCMKVMAKEWKAVEHSEGWKFVQTHDPWLELQVLQFLEDFESRQKRRIRSKRDEKLYLQLSEAMDCLEHICTEGCIDIGPHEKEPNKKMVPCKYYSTCKSLQLLIRHFANCKKRVPGGCSHCKRMWQLLRLHSSICDQPGPCKVPLCRQFKMRSEADEKTKEDERWRLLVRKVVFAKAVSCLSKRKREEELDRAPWIGRGNGTQVRQHSVGCC